MTKTTIQCPNCGTPNQADVENLIDVTRNPALKNALLSGRLNTVRCTNCGTISTVASPLLYHDPSKEMLISFVPMELNLPKEQQDRLVGDLLKQLTASIPNEAFKGYMFQPRQALTLQGLVDQILEADGITKEMMEDQRKTVQLIERLMNAGPDQLDSLLQENDAEIDADFFQAALAMTQRAAQDGREDVLNALVMIQERAAEISSYGQRMTALAEERENIVREVAGRIQSIGDEPQIGDIIDLALELAQSDDHLQALAGLIRPALDYEFFQELTLRIGQAPAAEREQMEAVRDRLLEFTQMIDQQSQMAMQNAARVLQAIINSDDVDAAIEDTISMIDDTFLAVLAANIQQAEQRADIQMSSRLKTIYEKIVTILQQNMQPELRFMNALLSTETDEEAVALLSEGIDEFGPALLEIMDSVGRMLGQQGNQELMRKMAFLREVAARQLDSELS